MVFQYKLSYEKRGCMRVPYQSTHIGNISRYSCEGHPRTLAPWRRGGTELLDLERHLDLEGHLDLAVELELLEDCEQRVGAP